MMNLSGATSAEGAKEAILDQARHVVAVAAQTDVEARPGYLLVIAEQLRQFASSNIWDRACRPRAQPGEELVQDLCVQPGRPSLYLVSDGVGVTSPPHCHGTWAIIGGIHGCEINYRYRRTVGTRLVVPAEREEISHAQILILGAEDIHSTEVGGGCATFHLHLYGCPLRELPPFVSRCYSVGGQTA